MKSLKASEVMETHVETIMANASVRDVALQILSARYSGVPVVDEQDKPLGVISELDILNAIKLGMDLDQTTAEDIMSKDVFTANPQTAIKDLIELMNARTFHRYPIVDQDGVLVGIISRRDILKAYFEPEFIEST